MAMNLHLEWNFKDLQEIEKKYRKEKFVESFPSSSGATAVEISA